MTSDALASRGFSSYKTSSVGSAIGVVMRRGDNPLDPANPFSPFVLDAGWLRKQSLASFAASAVNLSLQLLLQLAFAVSVTLALDSPRPTRLVPQHRATSLSAISSPGSG